MNFVPVSTIQTIPSYATQSIPVYGNALAPSINYGLTTPLISTANYGTTSLQTSIAPLAASTSFVQFPVTTPLTQTMPLYSFVEPPIPQIPINSLFQAPPQMIMPKKPSTVVVARTGDEPRYDLRPRFGLAQFSINPINTTLNQNVNLPSINNNLSGINGGLPNLNANLPANNINTGLKPELNNTNNNLNNPLNSIGTGLNNINSTANNINNATNNLTNGVNNINSGIS